MTVYRDENDIYEDIKDLAGVRVALYFPNQKVNVAKLIHQHFQVLNEKDHTGQEHEGYIAKHYFVRLKREEGSNRPTEEAPDLIDDGIVEIQVMSVLLNAWSNVGHDIVYKALHGTVSGQEKNILNGFNSLVLTGDWFLDTFHNTYIDRVKQENAPFSNHFELGAYLSKQFSQKIQQKEGGMKLGPVKVMYDLLETLVNAETGLKIGHSLERHIIRAKLNTPQGLDAIIDKISFEDAPGSDFRKIVEDFRGYKVTISVYVMNYILTKFPELPDQEPIQDVVRSKLEIMLSTMIWLDKLFPTSFAFKDNLVERGEEKEKRLLKWMYNHTDVRMVFANMEFNLNQKKRVQLYAEEAWQFFTRSSSKPDADPVVQFAFKLSRTGVLWKFPQNFLRLGKRPLGQDLLFPDWN